MADDDTTGPHHAENMSSINTPKRNVRIMWINTTQNKPIPQLCHELAHPRAEEARTRAEELLLRTNADGSIRITDQVIYSLNLAGEVNVAERSRRLIMHGVISELVVVVAD